MKMKMKTLLLICLSLCAMLLISGCAEKTAYEICDEEGFNVSIRFDANGGEMFSQVPSIVDTYNIADMKTNADGEVEIAILDPTDNRRGNGNVCNPTYSESGYYLVGWYANRTENPDGEGYIYSDPWNFETDRVHVDPSKDYSASTPVLTLYARWAKLLQVEVYDRANNELLGTLTYDPRQESIRMPQWKQDSEDGSLDMNEFKKIAEEKKKGYTFDCAYYDLEGTRPVDTEVLIHAVETNPEETTMKLFVDWLEGEWYHIYTADQFEESASTDGNYVICADLDFSDVKWPNDLMYGSFSGKIIAEGDNQYKFSNISATQTFGDKASAGVFGKVTAEAEISGIIFDNATFTIQKGNSNKSGAAMYFGLFSGEIVDGAQISNVQITNSTLAISSEIANAEDSQRYAIGLINAVGDGAMIDFNDINCIAVGDNPDSLTITVNGNDVEFVIN